MDDLLSAGILKFKDILVHTTCCFSALDDTEFLW